MKNFLKHWVFWCRELVEMVRPPNNRASIFQIFYDEHSKLSLDPNFIPLDNTANERPDWYEFWVIRNFLNSTPLKDDHFYGFLSPKFYEKTKIDGSELIKMVNTAPTNTDCVLVTSCPEDIIIYKNIFVQGERWHPGFLEMSAHFFEKVGIEVDLERSVSSLLNAVLSNYIIAKPSFWKKWIALANIFFDFVETKKYEPKYNPETKTPHGTRMVAYKVFIQERFTQLILDGGEFHVHVPKKITRFLSSQRFLRPYLIELSSLKSTYVTSKELKYIVEYERKIYSYDLNRHSAQNLRQFCKFLKYGPFLRLAQKNIFLLSSACEHILIRILKRNEFDFQTYAKEKNLLETNKTEVLRDFIRRGWPQLAAKYKREI